MLFPRGFTRDCIDGVVSVVELEDQILLAYRSLASLTDLENARMAQILRIPMVMIAS